MLDYVKVTLPGTNIEETINKSKPSRCRFCKKQIWFVHNDNGKLIPISEEKIEGSIDSYFVKHFQYCSKNNN